MCKDSVTITVTSDDAAGLSEQLVESGQNWTVLAELPASGLDFDEYDTIELTICDTEGE